VDYEITPRQVKEKLDAGERVVLIDVREPFEHQVCHIEGAHLIPMNTIPTHLQNLDGMADEATLVVFCHHGMRSLSVVNWLREQGVASCQSMQGGIERWSVEIDPAVPRY
jgi:rhodanese-related sulfurtransferase